MKIARIEGMCCEGCARDVKHLLESIYGISNVTVNAESGTATFDGFVSHQVIKDILEKEGYHLLDIDKL
ncbi:MAG: heavy metal-associated domain-containing protein [Candidatus Izemoplasmatales bacterium]|jgi:copper chaperone|nr:heavy metal-associated domain-containing protein [Candidatus Izemoplasmatales bacterium]MDY0373948.1 heavy metal-associated domain-containing protein [Candidatus Izemoplasmatales bacterium]NLF48020.1 heavy-metal-associated domain-containing protein [Acholeplasmataceae bacterium]